MALVVHGVFAGPVLNLVDTRIWFGPGNTNRIYVLLLPQIDHHPLRMERIRFASEWLCEIGIALPVGIQIAVIEAGEAVEFRPAVSGEAAMLQGIAIRMPDPIGGRSRSLR